MKKIAFLSVLLFASITAFATTHVRGHVTRRGTYVAPHVRTNRNHSRADNWSTKGNVNPYTGKRGTKKLNK